MKTSSSRFSAFTLVELLVSTAIIALIMLLLVQVTNNISAAWRSTAEKVEKFQEARDGFEAMTRRISQATLNTYWDYYDVSGITRNMSTAPQNFISFTYGRQSDLRFISGPMTGPSWNITTTAGTPTMSAAALSFMPTHGIFFAAPLGILTSTDAPIFGAMNNLLNTWGYFVEVGSDTDAKISTRPPFLASTAAPPPAKWRARLMEFREPTENMITYQNPTARTGTAGSRDWFLNSLQITTADRPTRVIAENVIALIIYPRLSKEDEEKRYPSTTGTGNPNQWSMLSPNFTYDSSILPVSSTIPNLLNSPVNPGAKVTSSTDATDAAGINPRNQLPPIITVTIVALDERSAQRLDDLTNPGPAQQPNGTFDPTFNGLYGPSTAPLFTQAITAGNVNHLGDAETPGTDMYTFTQKLVAMKLTYRIFSTNVTIRGAKWSRAQVN